MTKYHKTDWKYSHQGRNYIKVGPVDSLEWIATKSGAFFFLGLSAHWSKLEMAYEYYNNKFVEDENKREELVSSGAEEHF